MTSACGLFGPDEPETFHDRRTTWTEVGIRNYSFDFQKLCFCTPQATARVRITVTNGSITGVVGIDTGEDLLGVPGLNWPSIDSLFEIADRALREADSVTIDYDPEFHFPTVIDIDWIFGAADDEIRYTAGGLHR